jgi:hypothetical protein
MSVALFSVIHISGYTQNRPRVENSGAGFDFGIGSYYGTDERLGNIEGVAFRIGMLSNSYSNRTPVLQSFGVMNLQFGPGFSINYGYRFGISPLEGTLLRLKPYIELGPSLGLLFTNGEKKVTSKGTESEIDVGINGNLGAGFGFKYFYDNTTALNLAIRLEVMKDLVRWNDWGAAQIVLCFTILHF